MTISITIYWGFISPGMAGTWILEVGGKGRAMSTPGKWGVGRKGGGKGPGREVEHGRMPG